MDAFKTEALKIALYRDRRAGPYSRRPRTVRYRQGPAVVLRVLVAGRRYVGDWKNGEDVRYHGWDFRLLRWLKVTNRTGENLAWAETLTKASKQSYAVVACKDGSRFIGVVDTFSEEAGNYEILLGNASQVEPDGSLLAVEGAGVLLTRENPITRVELWNPRRNANVQGEGGG